MSRISAGEESETVFVSAIPDEKAKLCAFTTQMHAHRNDDLPIRTGPENVHGLTNSALAVAV